MHEIVTWEEFNSKYVEPFGRVGFRFHKDKGFIVWRRGTGYNVELLHIRTFEKGKGYGRELIYSMLDALLVDPPYYSVFGFTRVGNKEAQAFYGALGFTLQTVNGLYKDGKAILFWSPFDKLRRLMNDYLIGPY